MVRVKSAAAGFAVLIGLTGCGHLPKLSMPAFFRFENETLAGGMAEDALSTARPQSKPSRARFPMFWDKSHDNATLWTAAAIKAARHQGLTEVVPSDIKQFCPGYESASPDERGAFWAAVLSVIAKHESGFNPAAAGGKGRYLGLMQISKISARFHGCDAKADLKTGVENLGCAMKIAATAVKRDQVVAQGGGGVASDWGPMKSAEVQSRVANFTRVQGYCN